MNIVIAFIGIVNIRSGRKQGPLSSFRHPRRIPVLGRLLARYRIDPYLITRAEAARGTGVSS